MIYLDHHAATPHCAEALAAMESARDFAWASPSSVHAAGRRARALAEQARREVAEALGAEAADVILTSGGTEACNLGVFGLLRDTSQHVVTTAIEHPAVAAPIVTLEHRGMRVTRLGMASGVPPRADELAEVITRDTSLCAVQWVNHETGTILPVELVARICRERGVPLFVDATQALGKLPIDVGSLGATAVAIASHKIGGPPGAGALWARRGVDLSSRMLGGAQERGRRAGTPDVLALVGFGAACSAITSRLAEMTRIGSLRDRLEQALEALGGAVNGRGAGRVATVTNASFPERRGAELVAALDLEGVCASSGAACSSGLDEPSPVLRAMYPAEAWRAVSALRLSLGPETSAADVDAARVAVGRVLGRNSTIGET